MADAYPIVPLSFVDGLEDLNNALEVYNQLVVAWVNQTMREGPSGDPGTFAAGLSLLLKPVLEGYRDIQAQCQSASDAGLVSIATLDPDVAPQADSDSRNA